MCSSDLAGVPFVGAVARRPLLSGVSALTGILNGTSHFITTGIERGAEFADVLARAQAAGYAEPDSSADVSGRDAAAFGSSVVSAYQRAFLARSDPTWARNTCRDTKL